jgi:hypothetical protein
MAGYWKHAEPNWDWPNTPGGQSLPLSLPDEVALVVVGSGGPVVVSGASVVAGSCVVGVDDVDGEDDVGVPSVLVEAASVSTAMAVSGS